MSNVLSEKPFDLIVVGGGIAGMCAALRAAQNRLRTLVLLGDVRTAKASRVKYVYNIDNMMGLHPGLMREKYASLFKDQPEARQKVEEARFHLETEYMVRHTLQRLREEYAEDVTLVEAAATDATREGNVFEVRAKELTYRARHVVLATGVADRQPVIRKRRGDRTVEGIQWVYPFANNESFLYCIRCEGHLTRKTNCAVIGHTEDTAGVAMMLHERYGIPVWVVTNGEKPAMSVETLRVLSAYKIPVLESPIIDIKGGMGGRMLNQLVLEDGTSVPARYAMVAMGLYRVYNDLAVKLGMELEAEGPPETRHVLIDFRGESSISGAFSVGDMARRRDEPVMKQIYTAQEYAVRAVDAIDGRLRRERRAAVLASQAAPT